MSRLELLDAVLNLCAYHHPKDIILPAGYLRDQMKTCICIHYFTVTREKLLLIAENETTSEKIKTIKSI